MQVGRCLITPRKGSLPRPERETLLVLGSAPGFLEEAREFAEANPCDVAACNAAIVAWPGSLRLAGSLHADLLAGWVAQRQVQSVLPVTVGSFEAEGCDVVLDIDKAVGSSAMFLVLAGKVAGYQRIVLAGVRLDREIDRPYGAMWVAAKRSGTLEGVTSLAPGGWLKELLGS